LSLTNQNIIVNCLNIKHNSFNPLSEETHFNHHTFKVAPVHTIISFANVQLESHINYVLLLLTIFDYLNHYQKLQLSYHHNISLKNIHQTKLIVCILEKFIHSFQETFKFYQVICSWKHFCNELSFKKSDSVIFATLMVYLVRGFLREGEGRLLRQNPILMF
jgi:hypothetical protein